MWPLGQGVGGGYDRGSISPRADGKRNACGDGRIEKRVNVLKSLVETIIQWVYEKIIYRLVDYP